MEAFQIISVFELHISQILYESAICNDFLDEKFPDHPLNPKDPYRKSQTKDSAGEVGKGTHSMSLFVRKYNATTFHTRTLA